jgi:isopenicillin-N epimerase
MQSLRDQFLLDPEVVFLNHGSFGATPRPVFEAYQRWQLELERQPVAFIQRRLGDLIVAARSALGDYLGTNRDNLVLVTNVTLGLNIVARSLDLHPGDEVLTTDHEYGSMDGMFRFLAYKRGFTYINRPIPLPIQNKEEFIENFWQGVTPNTRVIFMSHITSPTAITFPVREICERARKAGIISFIDGAHAPGQIPLALDDLGADFYSGNLHKWLCAPKGTGFLHVRPEMQHLIEPLIVTGSWRADRAKNSSFVDLLQYNGTRDSSGFLAIPDAIQFQKDHNWPAVQQACHELAAQTRHRITDLTGLTPFYPDSPEWYAQMATSLLPKDIDLGHLRECLYDEYHIEIPLFNWNGYNIIRYSYQAYNSQSDVDTLLKGIGKFLAL